MAIVTGKVYINLHAEIDENGTLNLVDEDGRILGGVRAKSIHTAHEELSYANVEVILKEGDSGCARGKVKAPCSEPFSKEDTHRLADELNNAIQSR